MWRSRIPTLIGLVTWGVHSLEVWKRRREVEVARRYILPGVSDQAVHRRTGNEEKKEKDSRKGKN